MLDILKKKRCLIVLGMHRSGTSCLTGTIQQYGVELGEVFTQNPFNRKGNRENSAIQMLNDEVLRFNGGAWDQPVTVTRWTIDQAAQRDAIIAELKGRAAVWWGFKDPRVVLTLPFWVEALSMPRFIGTYRHPHRVALSLHERDRMSVESAYELWLKYNHRLLVWQQQYGFSLVDFDQPAEDYAGEVDRKLTEMGLRLIGERFFDDELRHQSGLVEDEALPAAVRSTYQQLRALHVVS